MSSSNEIERFNLSSRGCCKSNTCWEDAVVVVVVDVDDNIDEDDDDVDDDGGKVFTFTLAIDTLC